MSLPIHLIILFTGLALAVFATSLDETIVAVAAVNISDEFNSFNLYDWVTVSYLISLTGVQPLYGQISDIVGRKGPMISAVAVFFAANAACAWSESMVSLIVFRTIGGIGGGGMTGLSFVIVADLFPLVLTQVASWRWCFWIIMPFAGIAFLIIAFIKLPPITTLSTQDQRETHSLRDRAKKAAGDLCGIDWLGASLIMCSAPRHIVLLAGCTFFLLATTLIATELKSAPITGYVIMVLVLGLGGGMVLQSSFLEAQASVLPTVMFQYLGGAIGLAVAGIICRNSLARQLRNEPEEVIPSDLRKYVLHNPKYAAQISKDNPTLELTIEKLYTNAILLVLKALIALAGAVFLNSLYILKLGWGVTKAGSSDTSESSVQSEEQRDT
ncbi:hypothetical protein FANTH_4981 [Fusarium anthophilum]|uniref:Major facilitator superfamily (MFS) profile domain-containing protein n=1 Tax=Fusarium anthophilum TaxID=48485 RepID=A0A8H4ZMZ8_9HYPO|nr:hypothetical protein FANTH_4981 [Fusarium anthophilum]